jgi:hypothetical protein
VPTGPKGQKRPADSDAHKEQSERFKKTARELGCDEIPGALDRAFGKIEPKRRVTAGPSAAAFPRSAPRSLVCVTLLAR